MTVPAYSGPNTSIANGVTTVFPYSFKILHPSHLLVTVDGLVRQLGVHYTVEGSGNPGGGNVVFIDAPALNAKVDRRLRMPFVRMTDYQNLGDLLANTLNDDQDSPVLMIQQLAAGAMLEALDPDSGEFVWDAKGQRIIRVGDAVADADAMNKRSTLTLVEEIQSGGGGVGIKPVTYLFQDDDGEGLADGVATDFPIPQATVDDPGMYDVYFERTLGALDFVGMRPGLDYRVNIGLDPADSVMSFAVAPAAGLRGFAVLRGYARPWTGGTPLTTAAMQRVVLDDETLLIDGTFENALIVCTSNQPVTLTIRANTGSADADWRKGDRAPFFMVQQLGLGKVAIVAEAGATVAPPTGFLLESRAQGATFTAIASKDDTWTAAGDLLRVTTEPAKQLFRLVDRSVLMGTNIAVGTTKDSFIMPYDFMLDEVSSNGLYAGLTVAQAAGVLLTVDVNVDGVSIFATRLTFDNAEKTTITAATPAVYSAAFVTANRIIPAGAEVTIDVDQIGTALAKGLAVYLRGMRAN
ncbi:hypothetical protein ATCM_03095 [Stenotrophomonas sp. ATCM1_4]|uniref:hypothetical protein n=1 Tax=Stenotrophomonas sp. ATCM1_4 TaxID=2259330 RepID=UPI00104BF394|nr:hypothetical protein [Stenotrophomonas sp. ATCM1_4]TDB26721.1 hypothetical protein ATCM_03095 [Stenotrophomonas sp. ATCM1_4]